MKILTTILVLLASTAARAQPGADELRAQYERAYHVELGERDPAAAMPLYRQVLATADESSELTALALVRLGHCLRKLGRPDEAVDVWKQVLLEHEEHAAAAADAREALRELGGQTKEPDLLEDEVFEVRGLDTLLLVQLEGVPLDQMLLLLGEEGELSVAIDPALASADQTVTVSLRGQTIRAALDLVTLQHGLAWAELHGAIVIGPAEELWRHRQRRWVLETLTRPADAGTVEILDTGKLSLQFLEAPVTEVLSFFGEAAGLQLVVTEAARQRLEGRTLTLSIREGLVRDVLRLLVVLEGLEYRHRHGVLVIDEYREPIEQALERPVTFAFEDTPLTTVAATLAESAGVAVAVDPEVSGPEGNPMVTLQLDELPLRKGLTLLARLQGLDLAVLHGVVWIATPATLDRYRGLDWPEPAGPVDAPTDAALSRLKTTWVAADFQDAPLTEVLAFIRAGGQLEVTVPPEVERQPPAVTLQGKGLSLEQVLRLTLMPHGLTYAIEDGVVLVRRRD